MRCSDSHFYVVKFSNNPQHRRVLANELLATGLAEQAGLPVPTTAVVKVDEWLVNHTPGLHVELAHTRVRCEPGLHFGSRYVVNPLEGRVLDYLPMTMLDRVRNLEAFGGMLVLDKWTGNVDQRQAAFWRMSQERKYTASFIDQGNCFNAGEWSFPDQPLGGVYAKNEVYSGVKSWQSFEPWLSRIENMEEEIVWRLAAEIPRQWYGGDSNSLENLVRHLISRRGSVRSLIGAFRDSERNPFPDWHRHSADANSLVGDRLSHA